MNSAAPRDIIFTRLGRVSENGRRRRRRNMECSDCVGEDYTQNLPVEPTGTVRSGNTPQRGRDSGVVQLFGKDT